MVSPHPVITGVAKSWCRKSMLIRICIPFWTWSARIGLTPSLRGLWVWTLTTFSQTINLVLLVGCGRRPPGAPAIMMLEIVRVIWNPAAPSVRSSWPVGTSVVKLQSPFMIAKVLWCRLKSLTGLIVGGVFLGWSWQVTGSFFDLWPQKEVQKFFNIMSNRKVYVKTSLPELKKG